MTCFPAMPSFHHRAMSHRLSLPPSPDPSIAPPFRSSRLSRSRCRLHACAAGVLLALAACTLPPDLRIDRSASSAWTPSGDAPGCPRQIPLEATIVRPRYRFSLDRDAEAQIAARIPGYLPREGWDPIPRGIALRESLDVDQCGSFARWHLLLLDSGRVADNIQLPLPAARTSPSGYDTRQAFRPWLSGPPTWFLAGLDGTPMKAWASDLRQRLERRSDADSIMPAPAPRTAEIRRQDIGVLVEIDLRALRLRTIGAPLATERDR